MIRRVGRIVCFSIAIAGSAGCAGGKLSQVRHELPANAFSKSDVLLVLPTQTEQLDFDGDHSRSEHRNREDKKLLASSLSSDLVASLRNEGFHAGEAASGDAADAVVLQCTPTLFDRGSGASRVWLGFGSGASTLFSDLKIYRNGALIGDVEVAATSGGRGGLLAGGDFIRAHLEDTVSTVTEYLSERIE